MPFTPKSKSGQLADQLRARIAAGEWANAVPPERHLADEYVDVDFLAVARHAAGRCLAHGHRHLAVLVHRTELAGNEAVIKGVTEELRHHGAPPPVVLKHDFNRVRLTETLDRQVVAHGQRPDALIIINQHHFLTVLPHLCNDN